MKSHFKAMKKKKKNCKLNLTYPFLARVIGVNVVINLRIYFYSDQHHCFMHQSKINKVVEITCIHVQGVMMYRCCLELPSARDLHENLLHNGKLFE